MGVDIKAGMELEILIKIKEKEGQMFGNLE